MEPVSFYFDFLSPYSYLARTQFGALNAPIRSIPISVLHVMEMVNNTPTTITCSVKNAYAQKDLVRWATRYAAPLVAADYEALDGELLLRVATAAKDPELREKVVDAIFAGVWGGAGDASPGGLPALLKAAGLPADELIAAADTDAIRQALNAADEAAAAAGVFGAPTLRVGNELFFGNDRLDFVREAIAELREKA